MSNEYRFRKGTWTDGVGNTHDVVDFYVPGDDRWWAQYRLLPNGALERFISRAPIHSRTRPQYDAIPEALAAFEAAHRAWLAEREQAA